MAKGCSHVGSDQYVGLIGAPSSTINVIGIGINILSATVAACRGHGKVVLGRRRCVDEATSLLQHVPKYVHIGEAMTTLTATDARREFFDVVKGAADKH